jgi:hypothetical protein
VVGSVHIILQLARVCDCNCDGDGALQLTVSLLVVLCQMKNNLGVQLAPGRALGPPRAKKASLSVKAILAYAPRTAPVWLSLPVSLRIIRLAA